MWLKHCLASTGNTKVRDVATDDASPPGSVAPVRRVRRLLVLAVAGMLVLIGLVFADWWQGKREMGHLLDAVVVSNTAINTGYGLVNPHMKDSSAPVLKAKCATAAADVQDRGALLSEVFVLPWHRSLGTAQATYSAFIKAWQDKFMACADEPTRWSDGSTTAQVMASARVAHRAFIRAVPAADGSSRSRVEAIFKTTP